MKFDIKRASDEPVDRPDDIDFRKLARSLDMGYYSREFQEHINTTYGPKQVQIELNTIGDLVRLTKKYGDDIILRAKKDYQDDITCAHWLEIYDHYVE